MITVFLRKVTGKGQKLQIRVSSTVQELLKEIKQTLSKQYTQNTHSIEAYFRGELLNQQLDHTLQEAGIIHHSIIHIIESQPETNNISQPLRVKLILEEILFEYHIAPKQTVHTLKHIICRDLQIKDQEDLTLSFLGLELDNNRTIHSYQFVQDVLISASVTGFFNPHHNNTTVAILKQSVLEENEQVQRILREPSHSPGRRVKKAQSLNVQPSHQLKNKSVFCSVELNKIDEKVDQSRNESQLNEAEQICDEISQKIENNFKPTLSVEWQKPKLTLDSLSKPWSSSQQIIETQSIIDDQEQSQYLTCSIELIRTDLKRQYILECTKEDTFESALKKIASLERVSQSRITLFINVDEVSKSGISNRSSKGIGNSPQSAQLKKHRSSIQSKGFFKPLHQKHEGLSISIVDYATKIKNKALSIEFQILNQN